MKLQAFLFQWSRQCLWTLVRTLHPSQQAACAFREAIYAEDVGGTAWWSFGVGCWMVP